MIDMHSHILPSIDDGASCIEESVNMIREAYNAGFTAIVSTSHYIEESYNISKHTRIDLINKIENILREENINIQIYNGAEAYIATNLIELIKKDILPTLNNSRYLLMELPMNSQIIKLNQIVYDLKANGIIPIIAHPERYTYVDKKISFLKELYSQGVMFQCNYGSFIGKYGKNAERIMKKLLKEDLVYCLGTDVHRCKSTYIEMPIILKKLEKLIGKSKLNELSNLNPNKIIQNESIL